MKYIFAGSPHQARFYGSDILQLPTHKYQVVNSPRDVAHMRSHDQLVRRGTWYNRKDAKSIMQMAKAVGCSVYDAT